jgi:hypothetical protein
MLCSADFLWEILEKLQFDWFSFYLPGQKCPSTRSPYLFGHCIDKDQNHLNVLALPLCYAIYQVI